MVEFYNALFEARLTPLDAYGMTLYRGKLADLDLLLCPNEIAQVEVQQNRKQLRIAAENIEEIADRVLKAGGQIVNQTEQSLGVSDPDGNTLEFVQQ